MKIVLIRHAQTSANIDKVWHGHTDTPLTDIGFQQIESLGKYFHNVMKPDVIYTSPLQRAKLTAEAVAKNFDLSVNIDDRLKEFGIGEWEDISFERLKTELNFFPQMLKDDHYSAPGGESRFEVQQRVTSAIEQIVQNHNTENVVIVSHGLALSLALDYWFGDKNTTWSNFVKKNTAITEITLNPHRLVRFNNCDHLNETLLT